MNDERLATALHGFYHRSDQAPADVERSVGTAVDRIEHTRQRGRWWPLPTFAPEPTNTSDTHATQVAGGTRAMFSTTKIIAVAATVAVAGGLYTAGLFTGEQDSRPAAPPAAEAPSWSTPVTGVRVGSIPGMDEAEFPEHEDYTEILNFQLAETYEWTDPRLPSEAMVVLNLMEPSGGGWPGTMGRSSWLLQDTEGYWTGEEHLFADEATVGHGMLVLTGHDAYEGLSAILRVYTEDPDCTECLELAGYIFEAPLTPMPEPPQPSAE